MSLTRKRYALCALAMVSCFIITYQLIKLNTRPSLEHRQHWIADVKDIKSQLNRTACDNRALALKLSQLRPNSFDKLFRSWHWTWIHQRVQNLQKHWTVAREDLDALPFMDNRRKKRILILPGVLTQTSYAKPSCIKAGCPLGDLVQWADLIAGLHYLGHDVSVEADLVVGRRKLQQIAFPRKPLSCDSPENFDLFFSDYLAIHILGTALVKSLKCRLRVIDAYGTEPAFNDLKYAQQHYPQIHLGKLDLNPKQYFTFFPHTPDNTFLGFAVPPQETSHVQKENISLLYGKDYKYFSGKETLIHEIDSVFKVHSTLPSLSAPHGVINHGLMSSIEYRKLMAKAKVLIGVGYPVESSGALEAIGRGMVFLQPIISPDISDRVMRGKPTSRKLSSQVPYLEKYVGPPYVYTIEEHNIEQIKSALDSIKKTELSPLLPREFSVEGFMERLAVLIENQNFCDAEAPVWPPLFELKTIHSEEGADCVDTCHNKGYVCEPVFFPKVNDDHRRNNSKGDGAPSDVDIFYPALIVAKNQYIYQARPSLYSCAGKKPGIVRLCPCREYIKYQVALCKTCMVKAHGSRNHTRAI